MWDEVKVRVVNMILDNGVSLVLSVVFAIVIYYILNEQNETETQLFLQALENSKKERQELLKELLECYKRSR
jgi:hypothetical protein